MTPALPMYPTDTNDTDSVLATSKGSFDSSKILYALTDRHTNTKFYIHNLTVFSSKPQINILMTYVGYSRWPLHHSKQESTQAWYR